MKLAVSLIVSGDFTYLMEALRSLYATTTISFKTYVVINTDKGRADPQVDALLEAFPDIELIVNQTRQSFPVNHNQVMRIAEAEYAALLNDDITLHEGALDTLVNYLDEHPQVGLVGPQLYNADGSLQVSVYSDPSLLRMLYKISGLAILTHQQSFLRKMLQKTGVANLLGVESLKTSLKTRSVDIVKGAVMVVRRAAYEDAGMMDESYYAFSEEVDWHLRLRRKGWPIVYVAEAKVTHYGLAQARLTIKGNRLVEDRKSILTYFSKHRPRWQAAVIRIAIVIFHAWWGIIWFPFSRQRSRTHFQVASIGLG